MRILLINHYAGSPRHGMEYRPYYLARRWVARGHEVTIVAAVESHVRQVRPRVRRGRITEEMIDGIRYVWIPTPRYRGNGLRRALNIGSFVSSVLLSRARITGKRRVDAVIASSTYPLDIVAARVIAREAGAALLFEVHDVWPLSIIELGGISPRHPFIRLMQWAEDTAYVAADRVVSILPKTLPHMVSRGMDREKFAYVPNGVEMSEWSEPAAPLPEAHDEVLRGLREAGKLVVGYAGSHGTANSLNTIVDAGAVLRGEPVAFVLVGQGPEKAALQARASALGLDNIIFLPPVSKASIPRLLSAFDVACFALRDQPLYRFGISLNKLFDYMMAGRPVLQAGDAECEIVTSSGCGVAVPGEDPLALANAVRQFASMSDDARRAVGERGRAYVRAHHTYDVLADKFLGLIAAARERRVAE